MEWDDAKPSISRALFARESRLGRPRGDGLTARKAAPAPAPTLLSYRRTALRAPAPPPLYTAKWSTWAGLKTVLWRKRGDLKTRLGERAVERESGREARGGGAWRWGEEVGAEESH